MLNIHSTKEWGKKHVLFFKKKLENRGLLCRASTKSYLFSTWQYIRSVIRFENSTHNIKRGHIWSNFDTRCVRFILLNRLKNAKPPLKKRPSLFLTKERFVPSTFRRPVHRPYVLHWSSPSSREQRLKNKFEVISKCCIFANNHKQ